MYYAVHVGEFKVRAGNLNVLNVEVTYFTVLYQNGRPEVAEILVVQDGIGYFPREPVMTDPHVIWFFRFIHHEGERLWYRPAELVSEEIDLLQAWKHEEVSWYRACQIVTVQANKPQIHQLP